MFSLKGKTAVVTWAGKGSDERSALRMPGKVPNVVGGAHSDTDLATLQAETSDDSGTILTRRTDVTDAAQLERLGALAVKQFGGIDIWVKRPRRMAPRYPAAEPHMSVMTRSTSCTSRPD